MLVEIEMNSSIGLSHYVSEIIKWFEQSKRPVNLYAIYRPLVVHDASLERQIVQAHLL